MASDPIAARYAQALFESAKAEARVDETLETLSLIGQLIQEEPGLRQLLWNPDVDPEHKVGVLERALAGGLPAPATGGQAGWSDLVRAFLQMVVALGRSEYLPQIVEAFGQAVDADRGRLRAVIRSAHPVPEPILNRLQATLQRREGKTVELRTELDPSLVGGIQILLDHRVIDGSVRRQLVDLKERLSAIKVR